MLPDWLLGLVGMAITAIVAPIIVSWVQRRLKKPEVEAEVDQTEAKTDKLTSELLQGVILTLERQYNKVIGENDALRSRCEAEASVNRVLHEQKVHAEAYLTIAEAKLAYYEGRTLANSKAEGTQEE